MKKVLLVWVLGIAILAGCAQQGLSQNELFEKKKECANLQDSMLEQLKSKDQFKEQFVWEDKTKSEVYVKEVFYSPNRNSCLYTSDQSAGISRIFQVHDYFSKEVIYEEDCEIVDEDVFAKCESKFLNNIGQFKWEKLVEW